MGKLYRVIVELEVEADDMDDACRIAEAECSQSSFEGCHSVTEVPQPPVVDTAMEEGCRYERAFGDRYDAGD